MSKVIVVAKAYETHQPARAAYASFHGHAKVDELPKTPGVLCMAPNAWIFDKAVALGAYARVVEKAIDLGVTLHVIELGEDSGIYKVPQTST